MRRIEEALGSLFVTLREDLRREADLGLAIKAQGGEVTLRVRSQARPGDGNYPYFAVVVAGGDAAFRVSYKPSGLPLAERRVVIVRGPEADLLVLVRGYIEAERRRIADYKK